MLILVSILYIPLYVHPILGFIIIAASSSGEAGAVRFLLDDPAKSRKVGREAEGQPSCSAWVKIQFWGAPAMAGGQHG